MALTLIQGGGQSLHQCSKCGKPWHGSDDNNHNRHIGRAACGHWGHFNCQGEMIASTCGCPPSREVFEVAPRSEYLLAADGAVRKVARCAHGNEAETCPVCEHEKAESEGQEQLPGFEHAPELAAAEAHVAMHHAADGRPLHPAAECADRGCLDNAEVPLPADDAKKSVGTFRAEHPAPGLEWVHWDGDDLVCEGCGEVEGGDVDLAEFEAHHLFCEASR